MFRKKVQEQFKWLESIDSLDASEEINIPLSDSLQSFQDRLYMKNQLESVKTQIRQQQEQAQNSLVFKSIEEFQQYQKKRSNEQRNESVLKTILLKNKQNTILRCKKISKNTNLGQMSQKFGILTLGQTIQANLEYSNNQITDNSDITIEKTDLYHNLDGKIARQRRIQMIEEFSKIYTKKPQSHSPECEPVKHQGSKYRQAIQNVQIINHRKNLKNILPILPKDPSKIEFVLAELQEQSNHDNNFPNKNDHNSTYKLGSITTKNSPSPRIPKRMGGGFTKPESLRDESFNIYYGY